MCDAATLPADLLNHGEKALPVGREILEKSDIFSKRKDCHQVFAGEEPGVVDHIAQDPLEFLPRAAAAIQHQSHGERLVNSCKWGMDQFLGACLHVREISA